MEPCDLPQPHDHRNSEVSLSQIGLVLLGSSVPRPLSLQELISWLFLRQASAEAALADSSRPILWAYLICQAVWAHTVFDIFWKISCQHFDSQIGKILEEEMATHSSMLAWRIPWTEETSRLQSMGSQRVGHGWSDLACTFLLCGCMQSLHTQMSPFAYLTLREVQNEISLYSFCFNKKENEHLIPVPVSK